VRIRRITPRGLIILKISEPLLVKDYTDTLVKLTDVFTLNTTQKMKWHVQEYADRLITLKVVYQKPHLIR